MKTKYLVIIFILFLLITLASGLVVFLTQEKSERPSMIEKQIEQVIDKPVETAPLAAKKTVEPEKAEAPTSVNRPVEEKIKAVMIISGIKYEAAIKPGSSAYEAMEVLKQENKINFSGKDYSGLGFFVEEVNGLKNNPAGENWLYYVNGSLAPVGASNYIIKANDIIEWKYSPR